MKYTVIVAIDLDLNLVAITLHARDCFSRTCSSNTGRAATCKCGGDDIFIKYYFVPPLSESCYTHISTLLLPILICQII